MMKKKKIDLAQRDHHSKRIKMTPLESLALFNFTLLSFTFSAHLFNQFYCTVRTLNVQIKIKRK